jgi:cytochrome-b5 reductase
MAIIDSCQCSGLVKFLLDCGDEGSGGSGITPMLQVIEEILGNPDDKTDVSLVFGNLTPNDILLKDRLDDLAKKHSNFKVFYVVDKAPLGGVLFRGATGYITQDILSKQVAGPSEDCMILV